MSLVEFPRCTPSLHQLEDRCTPVATFTVSDPAWNPATKFSLPWAIAQANNTKLYPGVDQIVFDFTALGAKPVLNSTITLTVTEGVFITGANGNDYVTISGVRPFAFDHPVAKVKLIPGGLPTNESVLERVNFDGCAAPINQDGGAVRVDGGTVTLATARFVNNSTALNGGAVYVGPDTTLIVDGFNPGPTDWHSHQAQPRTLFKDNKAVNGDGGAIETHGTTVLKRGWFITNIAGTNGGAIDVFGKGVLQAPTLPGPEDPVEPDVQILANTALNGGGVYFNSTATSDLNGVILQYNLATTKGGGFQAVQGEVNLTGGQVGLNRSPIGPGGYVEGATVDAIAVSFFDNETAPGILGPPVEIGTDGILNTFGCLFNGDGKPAIVGGTNGQWNSDGFDIW